MLKKSLYGRQTIDYTYDNLNRLVQEEAPNNTYSYQYDSYGNRSQLSVTGDENYTTSYTYDKNNRMRNQTKTEGTANEITDFWYDPNGNQISSMTLRSNKGSVPVMKFELAGGDTNSYSEYNSWNQLTRTMQNGKTASYTYNGDGLRMSKTVDGTTTSHIWDGTNIAGDVTGGTVTKYIRGLQLISSKQGSNESFYTYNGHGDVVQLTNGTGAITKQYSYDAFGVETDKAENDTNPFRYCGEYYDTEIDSIYLRARYYRPTTGRFITEDPVKDGLNWYSYCAGNPVMFIDPSGLWGSKLHDNMTRWIFSEYGLNSYHANVVAQANANTDSGSTGPMPWQSQDRHFNRNSEGIDSRQQHAEDCLSSAISIWNMADEMYNNGEIDEDERHNYRVQALETLGTGLHSLQDIDAHLDYGINDVSVIIPHHTGMLSTPDHIAYFDDPQYNIYKDENGMYHEENTGSEFGSDRYSNSVQKSRDYIKTFYTKTGQM